MEALIHFVPAPLFVVAPGGVTLWSNARGRELRRKRLSGVAELLALAPDTYQVASIATWTHGSLRASRRVLSPSVALITVECEVSVLDEVVARCALAWALTSRQTDVLRLVLDGLANKEIATLVRTSPRTIEVHVTAIFDKAGVDSRTRLIAKSWQCGRAADLP